MLGNADLREDHGGEGHHGAFKGMDEVVKLSAYRQRPFFLGIAALVTLAAVCALVLFARLARADDEPAEVALKIAAALEAVDCTSTPPTITVLGLAIDVSGADIGSAGGTDGEDNQGEGDGEDDDPEDGGGGDGGCASLVVGQGVDVKLASDATPLAAREVGQDDGTEIELQAPIQAFDSTAQTVTVLGLMIDVSLAHVDGSNDDDTSTVPIDMSGLVVGQFAEIKLDSASLPALVASALDVKDFSNGLDVEVDDSNSNPIEDSEDDLDVTVTAHVRTPSGAMRFGQMTFHTKERGRFVLNGLPTGKVHIQVRRTTGGMTSVGRGKVRVAANQLKTTKVKLRRPRPA